MISDKIRRSIRSVIGVWWGRPSVLPLPDLHTRPKITLVTGPARSGKSEWAEQLATSSEKSVVYIATAQVDPDDAEWQERIAQHQRRRPPAWKTLAVTMDLATALNQASADQCLLVDSLGTWLANLLEQSEAEWEATVMNLLVSLSNTAATVVLVSEETGWGVVPAYPLGRLFRDRLGTLTRQVGAIAHSVYLVTGGYALNLRQIGILVQPIEAQNGK
jgi:adenosylcobinamide kinase/adenosylcobinamide-phosphate guanylyltransferase